MTPKQERFVQEYLIDLNATQAAIRAGYSAKDADVAGPRLLGNVGVKAAIAEAMGERASELAVDARWVLSEAVSVYREARSEGDRSAALKSLDLVGKHVDIAAFKDRIEHTGKDGGAIQIEQVTADAHAFTRRLLSGAVAGAAASGTGEA